MNQQSVRTLPSGEMLALGRLRIAKVLYDFIECEALPGTGIDRARFWDAFETLFVEFSPRHEAALRRRDELQAEINSWHLAHRGRPASPGEYEAFLRGIGYLVDEGPDFAVDTANVDPEIAFIAGPQLVVPLLNARYALNAANARWGSLYDALYGTDAIPQEGNSAPGKDYNPVRGERVIAYVRAFLDRAEIGRAHV